MKKLKHSIYICSLQKESKLGFGIQDAFVMITLQPLQVNSKADFGVHRKVRDLKLKIYSSKLMGKRKKVYKQSLISKSGAAEQVLW